MIQAIKILYYFLMIMASIYMVLKVHIIYVLILVKNSLFQEVI
jgi:hypothetical protein